MKTKKLTVREFVHDDAYPDGLRPVDSLSQEEYQAFRQEFRTLLDSKDKTIADLQARLDQAQEAQKEAQDKANKAETAATALQAKLDAAEEARRTADESAADRRAVIIALQRELDAAKGAEARVAEAQSQVMEAEEGAKMAVERAVKAEAELANIQAQAELEAEKSALKIQSAVLEARQEQQDRIAELMNENHALIREVADLKANASKPAPKARSTKTTASNTPETQ